MMHKIEHFSRITLTHFQHYRDESVVVFCSLLSLSHSHSREEFPMKIAGVRWPNKYAEVINHLSIK